MSDVRKVTITSCVPKKRKDGTTISGVNQYGNEWVLHSVLATDDTGLPIQEDMVSFAPLPLGEIECEFQRKDDEKYGTSYTLKQVGGPKVTNAPSQADEAHEMTRESIRMLADRVSALETAVRALGGFASTHAQTDVPAVSVAPGVGAASVPADDIPFAPSVI